MNKKKWPNRYEVEDLMRIVISKIDNSDIDRPTLPCKIIEITENDQYVLGSKFGIINVYYPPREIKPLGTIHFPELNNLPSNKISVRETDAYKALDLSQVLFAIVNVTVIAINVVVKRLEKIVEAGVMVVVHDKTNQDSIYAPSRDLYDTSSTYLAISSNGDLAATFNSETYEIIIYNVKELEPNVNNFESHEIIKDVNYPKFPITRYCSKTKIDDKNVSFSLAISNYVKIGKDLVVFVAVSSFCDERIKIIGEDKDDESEKIFDPEKGDSNPAGTFVYSTMLKERIGTTVDKRGGVIRFLNNNSTDQSKGFTNLIVMNASGITKSFINHQTLLFNDRSIDKRFLIAEEYELPTNLQIKIDQIYHSLNYTSFLNSIVEQNYLFVEDYKYQLLEMYDLQSMDLELKFEISLLKKAKNSIFSISKHGHLLAYCNDGTNCITIHLMENGLKVAKKEFTTVNKILSISFIDDDERLLFVTEEASEYDENRKIGFTLTINIWDLFTFKNDVRKFVDKSDIFSSLQKFNNHSIACSNGIILAPLQDEVIYSVLELSDIKRNLKSSNNISQDLRPITINQDGQQFDTNKQKRGLVVKDKEPWVHHKQYNRISSYLNDEKTIQLIIEKTTVQIWRKRGHDSKHKSDLEYIWVNPSNQMIEVTSLKIGKSELSLNLSWIVDSNDEKKKITEHIHWPNEAHVLKDSCVAIKYLNKRSDKIVGPTNLRYKELVAGTEKLIKKCIRQDPDLWSLSEVRYGIMAIIIRSKHISLLHWILFGYKEAGGNKHDKTRVDRYLHIPSQYKWPMEKKKSDLKLAIEQSSGENRMDKIIVAMLLEYYSNNAEKDTGWMFTLTKALPLLNNSNFESYLKELFYKPCFGSKVELIDSKFINQSKLKKGYKSEICSLNVRPRILLKQKKSTLWDTFKSMNLKRRLTEEEVTQVTTVRVVPLPDFTIYPTKSIDRTH
ncbi:476_t:CDS:2, partial [Funneliformis mosseae]